MELVERISKEIIPFLIAAGIVALILALTPAAVTYLPNLLFK